MELTGKQRRYLRGLGHGLQPLVQLGKGGVTPGITTAIDQALHDHELIKVRIGQNAEVDRKEAAAAMAGETSAHVAQIIGNTVLLYRARVKDPEIKLPAAARSGQPV